jgi:uncharacterized Zn finger protein
MECKICGNETRVLKVERQGTKVERVRKCVSCGTLAYTSQRVTRVNTRAMRKLPKKPPQSMLYCPNCNKNETVLLNVENYTISKTRLHGCLNCGVVFETDETYIKQREAS